MSLFCKEHTHLLWATPLPVHLTPQSIPQHAFLQNPTLLLGEPAHSLGILVNTPLQVSIAEAAEEAHLTSGLVGVIWVVTHIIVPEPALMNGVPLDIQAK